MWQIVLKKVPNINNSNNSQRQGKVQKTYLMTNFKFHRHLDLEVIRKSFEHFLILTTYICKNERERIYLIL